MKHSIPVLFCLLALLAALPMSAARKNRDCFLRRAEATICPSFHVFEDGVDANNVSGDGTTVVGAARGDDGILRPMRIVDGVRLPLDGLPPNIFEGHATAVSRDGSVIAGSLFLSATSTAPFSTATFRWRDGVAEMIYSGPLWPWSAVDMSSDGRHIALGRESSGARWEEGGEVEEWDLPGSLTYPSGISAEGDIIVGYSINPVFPLQWIDDVTTELLVPGQSAPHFFGGNGASDISPDGGVIVGWTRDGGGAVWRDGVFESREFGVSEVSWDGVFLAGSNYFWDAAGAVTEIEALLAGLGVEVSASPRYMRGMSYDGHVLIGRLHGGAYYQAVVAPKLGIDIEPRRRRNRIDLLRRRPVVVRIYGSEQADASDIDPEDLRFGPERAQPMDARAPRDYNRDGYLDRDYTFDPVEAGLALGDREACLAGVAADLPFRLCSRIKTNWGRWSWLRRLAWSRR